MFLVLAAGCGPGVDYADREEVASRPCGSSYSVTITGSTKLLVNVSVEDALGQELQPAVRVNVPAVTGFDVVSGTGCPLNIRVGDLDGAGSVVDLDFDQAVRTEVDPQKEGEPLVTSNLGKNEFLEVILPPSRIIKVRVTPLTLLH